MFTISDVPDHPSKNQSGLPFDIEKYITNKYNTTKKYTERKYNNVYLKEKLLELDKSLENERKIYLCWFNHIIGKFQQDIATDKNVCHIEIELYGPNTNHSTEDKFMIENVLKNLYFILGIKGYPYKTYEKKNTVVDCMDGVCIICTNNIEINLN